jgi:hypothetical protein
MFFVATLSLSSTIDFVQQDNGSENDNSHDDNAMMIERKEANHPNAWRTLPAISAAAFMDAFWLLSC